MAKGKGINPIEQHIEKIVLGVVGVVFLGVVAMQFVGGGTKVSVDNQELDPDAAMAHVGRKAETLLTQVKNPSPELPEAPAMGIAEAWQQGRTVGEPMQVASLMRNVGPVSADFDPSKINEDEITGDYKYPALAIAGPDKPQAVSFPFTLDPFEVASSPEVRAIVPVSQPFDIAAISVEASFDAEQLRATLSNDPDGEGRDFAPIPNQWWRDNVEVIEVHLERAEGLDAAGEPINLVLVAALPGRETLMDLMPMDGGIKTMEDANELVGVAREEAARVREPRFYRAIAGAPWMSPSDFAKLDEIEARQSEIAQLVRRYDKASKDLEGLERRLAEAGAPAGGRNTPADPHGKGNPRQPRQRDPVQPQIDPKIRLIEGQIDETVLNQQRIELELEDLGVDPQGEPLVSEEQEFVDPLLDADRVRLLAHDVDIEPGKTYVYRMRIVVNNPLFGHGQQLHEDQGQLASNPMINSDWSDWSDPVSVLQNEYFFVTTASEGDQIGGPRAGVEVYQYWYGYWRKGVTSIEPGDFIAVDLRLPDANLLPIFDMERLALQTDNQRNAPGRGPGRTPHGQVNLDLDSPDEELPPNAIAAEPLPPVSVDYVLLDVASVPGATGRDAIRRAIFRGDSGGLVWRHPQEETSQALYERVKNSAAEGLRQGRPEPEPEPEDVFVPPVRPIPTNDDPPAPGGG